MGVIIDGRMIIAAISLICSTTNASASDFVNAYVLGMFPSILEMSK